MEENNIILSQEQAMKSRDTGLCLNRNDKDILSYGAKKIGLSIYKKKGWLEYYYLEPFREGLARVTNWEEDTESKYGRKKIYNFINKEGNLLSEEWFDFACNFRGGFAKIRKKNRQYNFIDRNGAILSKERFDYTGNFKEGFASVEKNGEQNFINKNGELLLKERYVAYYSNDLSLSISESPTNLLVFSEGYAPIKKGKRNFIDKNGNLLSERWFSGELGFSEGYAKIWEFGKGTPYNINFIDKNGNLLFQENLVKKFSLNFKSHIGNFKEGYARIEKELKRNFIDKNGNLLSEEWFDSADYFSGGYAKVQKKGKRNLIDKEGKILFKEWFEKVGSINEGYFKVAKKIGKGSWSNRKIKENIVDINGNYLSKERFDSIGFFYEGFAKIEKNGINNFINKDGKILLNKWFDYVRRFSGGFATIDFDCLINTKGEIISNKKFDYIGNFSEGYIPVRKDDKRNFIDKNGNLLF